MSSGKRCASIWKNMMLRFVIGAVLILTRLPVLAEQFTGKVVGVHDSDTMTVLADGARQGKVRLADIDAPELGQAYGDKAKAALAALAFNKTVKVEFTDKDRYGRLISIISVDGKEINSEMIRRGHAWVYEAYAEGEREEALLILQRAAVRKKAGLWALQEDQRIAPWTWREQKRRAKPEDRS